MIYHMAPAMVWKNQPKSELYVCESLDTEGFIHCTDEQERLVWVANHFYRDVAGDFVILYIDEALLQSELKWEEADGHSFPHIYGPLNCDAVINVIEFPRNENGAFQLPNEWTDS